MVSLMSQRAACQSFGPGSADPRKQCVLVHGFANAQASVGTLNSSSTQKFSSYPAQLCRHDYPCIPVDVTTIVHVTPGGRKLMLWSSAPGPTVCHDCLALPEQLKCRTSLQLQDPGCVLGSGKFYIILPSALVLSVCSLFRSFSLRHALLCVMPCNHAIILLTQAPIVQLTRCTGRHRKADKISGTRADEVLWGQQAFAKLQWCICGPSGVLPDWPAIQLYPCTASCMWFNHVP